MKKVIIINGKPSSGKDQFIEYCAEVSAIKNISSVDKVKEAATVLGWNGAKEESDRNFLHALKDLSISYNNQPTTYILEEYEKFMSNDNPYSVLFIHIREPEHIQEIMKLIPSSKALLIINPRIEKVARNYADQNTDEYGYDYFIHNDSTLEVLRKRASEFISNIRR